MLAFLSDSKNQSLDGLGGAPRTDPTHTWASPKACDALRRMALQQRMELGPQDCEEPPILADVVGELFAVLNHAEPRFCRIWQGCLPHPSVTLMAKG